jgi:hypothetical protein
MKITVLCTSLILPYGNQSHRDNAPVNMHKLCYLEKLAVIQLVKKFLSFMEHKVSFYFHFHKILPLNAIITQLNNIHTLTFL